MRPTLIPGLLAALAVLGVAATTPAAAQSGAEMGRALSTVMYHRSAYLADSAQFEACTVQRAMNGIDDYPSYIIEPIRGLLGDTASPCPRQRRGRWDHVPLVLVDSLRFTDTTAMVYLTVLRGELEHRENYTLGRNNSSAAYMPILDVRLWGHGQAYGGEWPGGKP